MIKVKGFKYYNDNHRPSFETSFENLGQLAHFIQNNTIGKKVRFPAQNADGIFNQDFAGSFSGNLRYDSEVFHDGVHIYTHIELIKDQDEKILFSSGSLTNRRGHISQAMRDMLKNLREWTEEAYEFAD